MTQETDKFIAIPKNLDYRATDFYDLEEDERDTQCTQLYEEFADVNKRYTEVAEIASGGMKIISRAYDQKTGRYVAMASVKENLGKEPYGPFLAEARLTAALHHPNIIKVHDIDYRDDGSPYFTMDLKLGDSLNEILKKLQQGVESYTNLYTTESLLNIFIKICDAVSYSHAQSILHLDIKPENVQVGEHGEVLLCDWGLARQLGDKTTDNDDLLSMEFLNGQTLVGKVRGTPGFMAPELLKDKKKRALQSDVYALGAVLYTILTYQNPIDGDVQTVLLKTKNGDIIAPIERCPDKAIPKSLNAVVMKAMAYDKHDRYATVNEFTEDVRKYLFGYATSAENAGFLKGLMLFYKRNKNASRIAATSLFILMMFVYAFIIKLEKARLNEYQLRLTAEQQRKIAEDNFQKYKEEKELADLSLAADPSVVLAKIKEYYHSHFLDAPKATLDHVMKSLERIKESNDSAILLYEFKGDVHFVREEFDLALKELQKGRGAEENPNLFKALKSVEDYQSSQQAAPIAVINTVLDKLSGDFVQQQVRMMIYDGAVRAKDEDHLQLVKRVFTEVNRVDVLDEFSYDFETKTLIIDGDFVRCSTYIAQFDQEVSLLSTLGPEHLIIKGTERLNTPSLGGLNLKTLDLSGVKLDNLYKFIKRGVTEKLIINKATTDPELLKLLKKEYKIVFKPE
ncbi:serine/threonine-protein kinase [Lentisphaera profundi]|uniref:Serine/threonine-protein kinase n=1 Tax=Lentisphaera profundi TaxID=1658616 RepID=A0ABY7VXW7_9BACT|nr:serine/threonine-protein kinase [Lentisphaera profundi]WDE96913.1 serine/threonine-protein kinase [Lentisphaera profundi]